MQIKRTTTQKRTNTQSTRQQHQCKDCVALKNQFNKITTINKNETRHEGVIAYQKGSSFNS